MRKPTKTKSVSAGTRIYYFDALNDSKGQPYLSISEVPVDRSPGPKKRQRIFVHIEDIEKFADALNEMLKHMRQNG